MEESENKVVFFLVSLATLGIWRFFSVPQGYVCLVTAFGKYIRQVDPGLGSCLSFWGLYQRPYKLVSVKQQTRNYPKESVFTGDGVRCAIDVFVVYKIVDPVKAVFEIENYEGAIKSLVQATLRNECGNLAARQLLAGRQQLVKKLKETLDTETETWGISVQNVEITEIEMER